MRISRSSMIVRPGTAGSRFVHPAWSRRSPAGRLLQPNPAWSRRSPAGRPLQPNPAWSRRSPAGRLCVLAVICSALATAALAHGPAWDMAAVAAAGTDPAPPGLDAEAVDRLEYFYRLFSDTCHQAPTDLQAETLSRAEAIYSLLHGFQAEPPPAAAGPALMEATLAHYALVRQRYATAVFTWNGTRFAPVGELVPLDLAAGVARHILVEITNASGEDLVVRPPAPLRIPPGASRALLVALRSDSQDASTVTVGLTEGQAIRIPVAVQAAVLVRGTVLDAATDKPSPGRIRVRCSDGILRHGAPYAHIPTLCEKPVIFRPAWQKLPFFYCDGTFEIRVPPGPTEITLERGYETDPITLALNPAAGGATHVTLAAVLCIAYATEGWVSGDTHIHWAHNAWDENLDLDLLAVVQRAEDLRVANNLTLYQWRAPEAGGIFIKPDQAPMGPVDAYCREGYHIQMAEEYRNDNHYGHINLLNITSLIQPVATGPGSGGPPGAFDYPLNRDAILEARAQGGISIEAHNLGPYHCSCVPVHVALGLADSLDQLDPEHYYRFLNSGFHIGLSNGSDHPARTAGSCRVYVKTTRPFSYANWIDGLRHGRTFTTSGPLLFLTVNGKDIGDTLDLPVGTPLRVRAKVLSRRPVGTFELVSNGEVLRSVTTEAKMAVIEADLNADASRWFAVRASRGSDFNALNHPDTAHSSAVYVRVDGREVVREDAVRFWIDNVERHAGRVRTLARFENDAQRREALEHIEQGRQVYVRLLDQGSSSPVSSIGRSAGSMAPHPEKEHAEGR